MKIKKQKFKRVDFKIIIPGEELMVCRVCDCVAESDTTNCHRWKKYQVLGSRSPEYICPSCWHLLSDQAFL